MSFIESIKSVFSQYVGFSGRARRSEYWWFALFVFIIEFILAFLGKMNGAGDIQGMNIFTILTGIFCLAIFLPSLAVTIRRLHDTGKSGWWVLLYLIPVIGEIIILIFCLFDSEPGVNKYGPNPKKA